MFLMRSGGLSNNVLRVPRLLRAYSTALGLLSYGAPAPRYARLLRFVPPRRLALTARKRFFVPDATHGVALPKRAVGT
jgi:hypothetical protein